MRPEELVALIRKQPFLPLRIHMTDRKTYELRHPGQIIVGRGRVDIGVADDTDSVVVDRVDHCS